MVYKPRYARLGRERQLNRSLFEYWIRILFYANYPDKASLAIRQLQTRIGKIDNARADIRELDALSEDECDELERFAATGPKIERENFRNDVLEKVMSKDDADRYYDPNARRPTRTIGQRWHRLLRTGPYQHQADRDAGNDRFQARQECKTKISDIVGSAPL